MKKELPNIYRILVTGAKGFIGRNLIERLNSQFNVKILEFDKDDGLEKLSQYCKMCDFVFNFAAVHRPTDSSEFNTVNFLQFNFLLDQLKKNNNCCPVLYTSSIQSNNGTLYGKSKFDAECALKEHSKEMNSRGIIYRLTNTFGQYARPYSHSVVATFCASTVEGIPLLVSYRNIIMHFAYIDDVIDSFISRLLEGNEINDKDNDFYEIASDKIINISLGELADLISSFPNKQVNDITSSKELLFFRTYEYYRDKNKL